MKNNPFLSILIPLWGVVSLLAGCADGGDAVSLLQVSAARVEVGKNGLTADGLIPSIDSYKSS